MPTRGIRRVLEAVAGFLLMVALAPGCLPPQPWSQFHADSRNEGFIVVRSKLALQPQWSVPLGGPAVYSSPVIAPDGTIIVGTFRGELVGVAPDGRVRFRRVLAVGEAILGSAAVAPDGTVYVVTVPKDPHAFRCTLHSVTPGTNSATVNWSVPLSNASTAGSPKVWGSGSNYRVFLHVLRLPSSEIVVFDPSGSLLQRVPVCGAEVLGGGGVEFNFPPQWWKDLVATFPVDQAIKDLATSLGPPDPTVAIADYSRLLPGDQPIVVASDNWCGIQAFRWSSPHPSILWQALDDGFYHSSPAALSSGSNLVIVGRDLAVTALDVTTGMPSWQYIGDDVHLGTPPAYLGRQIYATSADQLVIIDGADGSITKTFSLEGKTIASPALTASHVYVSTTAGFYSFSTDLSQTTVNRTPGGLSSPAVSADGVVYNVTADGSLQSYPAP